MEGFTPLEIGQVSASNMEGFTPLSEDQVGSSMEGFTPLIISDDPEPVVEDVNESKNNELVEGGKNVAKFVGKQLLGTAETAMSLASGAVLWPFSKAWGVLNLPFGAEAAKKAEEAISSLGYTPYTDEGKAAIDLVSKGFELALKPAHMAEEATKNLDIPYSDEAAYLVGLGSELLEFAIGGSAAKGVKTKLKPKEIWDKPVEKFPDMDTDFADAQLAEKANEINIRRAKQKVQGKPLAKLKRKEEMLSMEQEGFKSIDPKIERAMEFDKTFEPILAEELVARTVKDTIQDVNTLIGKRGSIGDASLSPEQMAAYNRLSGDIKVFKRNAKRVGKSVEDYLIDMKFDPKVAALLGRKSGELKKYAGSINLERQDIPNEFKQFETEIQKPKRIQTWDETGKLSKDLLKDYKKASNMLQKGKKGEAYTAVEIDAARQMNVNAISSLKETLQNNPEKFKEQYQRFKTDIFDTLADASSEAGRALNIHKKMVSVDRMGKAFSKLKRNMNERELKEFNELDLENPLEIKRFINRLGDPKLSDYFLEYWYNSILSGPPTHIVNVAGNTLWMAYQVPHHIVSSMVDLPISKFTGRPRTRYLNEVVPMLAGFKTGFMRGKKMAGQMMRHGKIQDFESKWAQEMSSSIGAFERSPNPILRKAAKYITPPTKALRAMDAWANAIGYDATVNAMARRSANILELKGKERAAYEKKFAENLSQEQHMEAMEKAKHFTFMDDPDPVTALIIKARNTKVVGPALKLTVLPFVNTISNLMKRGMEFTPGVGLVKEAISRGMERGNPMPEVIAKQIEGAVIAYYVWNKINNGEITGSLPDSKNEREAWYRQGKMPWAIKMGDTWMSYRRIEPFNTVIASAYVAFDKALNAKDQETIDEIFFEIAQGMKNNVIDGSYFQGLQTVMNRHQKAKGAMARFSASWVPYSSFFRSMSRAYEVATEGEATARNGGEYQKAFSSVLPWLVDKPPHKLNVWGEKSVIPGGMLRQWLPFKWSEATDDPVEKEFEKLGFYPGVPSQTVTIDGEKVKLDDDIYQKYVHSFGSKAKNAVSFIISNEDYQRISEEGKMEDKRKARLKKALLKIRTSERRIAIKEQYRRKQNDIKTVRSIRG